MKTENREKEYTGLMESLESRTVRGRDREREREKKNRKLYSKKLCVYRELHLEPATEGNTRTATRGNRESKVE